MWMLMLANASGLGGSVAVVALLMAAGLALAATGAAVLVGGRRRRRRLFERGRLLEGFVPLDDAAGRAEALDRLAGVFGQGATLEEAMSARREGFEVTLIHARFPAYRVDHGKWDPATQESDPVVVVLVGGFGPDLPSFGLTPNSWLESMVSGRRRNIFAAVRPFGRWNHVTCEPGSEGRVFRLMDHQVRSMLMPNRGLVVHARTREAEGYLLFHRPDVSSAPGDLRGLLERWLSLAMALRSSLNRTRLS